MQRARDGLRDGSGGMRSSVGEGHDFVVDSVRCRNLSEVREQKEAACCITGVQSCSLDACYCLILRCTCAYLHNREHIVFFFCVSRKKECDLETKLVWAVLPCGRTV